VGSPRASLQKVSEVYMVRNGKEKSRSREDAAGNAVVTSGGSSL
jgi:hypothetical protein